MGSRVSAEIARRILSNGLRDALQLTPREQAEAAHWAGGPSVDELEAKVIAFRLKMGISIAPVENSETQ